MLPRGRQELAPRIGNRFRQSLNPGGLASALPTLYGLFPIWHASVTTPNADGAISDMTDISLGLYPLSQGTGTSQPTRGSGVVTFDGSNDFMSTAAAGLLTMGNLTAHDACILMAAYMASSPASAALVMGWNSAITTGNRLDVSSTSLARARKEVTAANSATSIGTSIHSIVIDFLSGAEGDALVYVDGSLIQTLAVTGSATSAPTSFSVGGFSAASQNCAVVLKSACAMNRASTSTERSQWGAWVTAGCPL